jgi:ankyrin repeat protein
MHTRSQSKKLSELELINTSYVKVMKTNYNHKHFQYKEGLNILDKPFQKEGSGVPGGLYYTTLEHVHNFYQYGNWIVKVIPDGDIFVDIDNKHRTDRLIVTSKRYNLNDLSTYTTLGLPIPHIWQAARSGHLEMVIYIHDTWKEYMKITENYTTQNDFTGIVSTIKKSWKKECSVAIRDACITGQLSVVKYLHGLGYKNAYDMDGACKNGHLDMVIYLHSIGRKISYNSSLDIVRGGNLAIVKFMYESGVKLCTVFGNIACRFGYLDIVEYLHDHNVIFVNAAVERAITYGHLVVVQYLHSAGITIDNNLSMLKAAVSSGNLDTVKYIFDNEVICDAWENIVMKLACTKGYLEIVEYLYDRDIYPSSWSLENAVINGHLDVVKYIYELELDLEYGVLDVFEKAVENGHLDVVKYLYVSDALEADTVSNLNIIHTAALNGHLNVVQYLYENGVRFNYDTDILIMLNQKNHTAIINFMNLHH